MERDSAMVVKVIVGCSSDLCCKDVERLRALRKSAIDRLEAVMSNADDKIQVGDESWAFDRFLKAIEGFIDWVDNRLANSSPLGFVKSAGPQCMPCSHHEHHLLPELPYYRSSCGGGLGLWP